jgi:hypothetical protein
MPRERRTSLFPVAVSPARAADALGIRAEEINEAIKHGELHCYVKGIRRRVLIADLVEWVRHYWKEVRHASLS